VGFQVINSKNKRDLYSKLRIYDLDDSGTIDKEEMSRIITAMLSMAGETAGDTQEKAEARVEKIFQVMDVDGNGELSREEFLQAAKKDQSIVAALNFIRC
jgi:Ca2+-binding EF-hand superfamily protein